jgi:hypothetical protein
MLQLGFLYVRSKAEGDTMVGFEVSMLAVLGTAVVASVAARAMPKEFVRGEGGGGVLTVSFRRFHTSQGGTEGGVGRLLCRAMQLHGTHKRARTVILEG